MAEKSAFFNAQQDASTGEYDRVYLAEDFAAYFSRFISNGVFPNPSTGLQVVAAAAPNMTVSMNAGYAYINGYTYENTENYSFNIDVADGVLGRKDAIFIRYDLANRYIRAYKAKGTPSAAPVAPTPLRTEDYWDLCVAIIHVDAGIVKIDQSLIEDTRMNNDLCGIVHGLVEQIDTTTLYKQVQQDLTNFQTINQAEFETWFTSIKDKLSEASVVSLQNQIDALDPETKRTNVFAAMTHRYYATFLVDNWTQMNSGYTQTAALTADTRGPAVASDSIIMSGPMCKSSGVFSTDRILLKNLGIINSGHGIFGTDTVKMLCEKKPSADITVYWDIKKNV